MSSETSQSTEQQLTVYLEQLHALISSMTEGLDAIANNSLDVLKQNIVKQEVLCADLASSGHPDCVRFKQLLQSPYPIGDAAVDIAIWTASNTIRQLNLQTAALLKHSTRTISLLWALCSNHAGHSNEPHGLWSKQQTWSCEI